MSGLTPLNEFDPELYEIIQDEKKRQYTCLELIASENFVNRATLDCLGSILTNKYSEGNIGKRYYGGNENIDRMESLCIKRALKAFDLDGEKWHVNVQPYSGSPANLAVYTALLKPHDRIMGLDLPSGGHLTHGFYLGNKKISASSIYFESLPYKVNQDGYIDYEELEKLALLFRPKMIIAGGSAYPRDFDYKRFREIADKVGAYLMADMAHISGLVATKECNSPFEYCDVVTSTTHKTLRGPRTGIIFCKKEKLKNDDKVSMPSAIDQAVFPSLQGGPHNHQIAALCTQLKEVATPEFKEYIVQVKKNAVQLAQTLKDNGFEIVTDGTENHLVLWNLRKKKITGSKVEKLCDAINITVNKNSIQGDVSMMNPSGIRLGTPALTTRGFVEKDFVQVANFLTKVVEIGLEMQKDHPEVKKVVDFEKLFDKNEKLQKLKKEVEEFAKQFPMPGFDVKEFNN